MLKVQRPCYHLVMKGCLLEGARRQVPIACINNRDMVSVSIIIFESKTCNCLLYTVVGLALSFSKFDETIPWNNYLDWKSNTHTLNKKKGWLLIWNVNLNVQSFVVLLGFSMLLWYFPTSFKFQYDSTVGGGGGGGPGRGGGGGFGFWVGGSEGDMYKINVVLRFTAAPRLTNKTFSE